VPIDASAHERDQIVSDFRKALDATGHGRADGDTNLFRETDLPGRRVHGQRPARAGIRAAEDDARDRPRRGARGDHLRVLGWREGVETDSSKDPLVAFGATPRR
jgi:hypothetical protein